MARRPHHTPCPMCGSKDQTWGGGADPWYYCNDCPSIFRLVGSENRVVMHPSSEVRRG